MSALTTKEAAFVVGASDRSLNRVIDRDLPKQGRSGSRGRRKRRLGPAEILYIALCRESGDLLSKSGRAALYRQLRQSVKDMSQIEQTRDISLTLGPFKTSAREIVDALSSRLAELRRINDFVVSDPEIRGGEPVIRGTRVPVYMLAELRGQGVSEEEILEDYPSVSMEALSAAVAYARVRPRRGRPPAAPWRE